MLAGVVREVFRREAIPARARWWLAAAGMRDWYRFLASRLAPHFEGDRARSRACVAAVAARTLERRYDALRAEHPSLPDRARDPRAVALVAAALYRTHLDRDAVFIFDALGGAPRTLEWARAARLVAGLSSEARWREVTVHLGELLIVMTEDLPRTLPHARRIFGEVCFEAGVRYAKRMTRAWRIDPSAVADAPALAIEILRTSEYLFRVNPEHRSGSDAAARTGFIEGSACPWYERPGWNGAHCGIFGQFQSGVSSVLGLRYALDRTIPKHGGSVCRIELKPIQLRVPRPTTSG